LKIAESKVVVSRISTEPRLAKFKREFEEFIREKEKEMFSYED